MTRTLRVSFLKSMWIAVACLVTFAFVQPPVVLAQHVGAHVGGGSISGGVAHASAPPSSHAPASQPRASAAASTGKSGNLRLRPRPVQPPTPPPPSYPVYGYPFFFGEPFYGFGWGWGFDSCWWLGCDPFGMWGWGYNSPFSAYGSGAYAPPPAYANPPNANPPYANPPYAYGDERSSLPQLYLKNGMAYDVTDYWLVNGQIHFTMLEEGGTQPVERVIDFDELDLQTTIDVAARRGFRFVLRNAPLDQYLQDHPGVTPPSPPPHK